MEDFARRLRSGAGKVGFGADKQRRILQVQSDLRGLRKQVDELVVEVGRKAVELYADGQIEQPELAQICEQAAALEAEIAAKEAEIEAIKDEEYVAPAPTAVGGRMCPQCQIELPAAAAFCPQCGTAAVDIEPEPEPEPELEAPVEPEPGPLCTDCGAELNPGAVFCHNCGAKVGGEAEAAES